MARCADHPLAHRQRTRTGTRILQNASVQFNRLVRLWRFWRRRSHERRLAAQFTDRDLWDVGLTRGDIYREFARPFWQAHRLDRRSHTTESDRDRHQRSIGATHASSA